MARIPYVDHTDLADDDRALLDSSSPPEDLEEAYRHLMSTRTRNSYRAIGHFPDVLAAYRDLVEAIKRDTGLTVAEQEYVILRCAREIPSEYEWHNHVRIALNAGVEADAIRAIADRTADAFPPKHRALLEYVDAFLDGAVDDDAHAALAAHYDDPTIAGICLFAGYWLMNACVVDALGVETEEPFVGWNLENV
jgi:alkylhydroperoxidase family enzyme